MTFCVAMKVENGLVGLADTRVTSGAEHTTARKVYVHQREKHALFLMTSGLRSVRDKALTYFEESLESDKNGFDRLYKAVNAFADQVRRVAEEDKEALTDSGFDFDLFSLVGGQLENDREHKLYLLYPQANWIEVTAGTPYCLIGQSSYGKPLLERSLRYDSSMETALKIASLAFLSTRTAATNVDFPLDVVLYARDSHHVAQHRYEREDLRDVDAWWRDRLCKSVEELPADFIRAAIDHL